MLDFDKIKNLAHKTENKKLFLALKSRKDGLTSLEVAKRAEYKNILFEMKTPTAIEIFLRQFNKMTLILIVAGIIAFLIHHYHDSIGIFFAAIIAMFFGFIQEYKAEEQLKYLYKLTKPKAKVFRDKKVQLIDSTEIVPGDILILNAGDLIPADCKIIKGEEILVDQAILTGESEPIRKSAVEISSHDEMAEKENILYAGTYILKGDAKAIVIATGKLTEFGKITSALTTIKQEPSELSKDLEKLGNMLVKISLILVSAVFILGMYRELPLTELLISSVLLFVAAIPEGLPTVLAITLAYGVRRLAEQNAIVKKLAAISSIGKVNIICADKTGTLTKNQLKIVKIFSCFEEYDNFSDIKDFKENQKMKKIIEIAALASRIVTKRKEKNKDEKDSDLEVFGDPLESEIGNFYYKLGYSLEKLYLNHPVYAEFPFDFKRRSACYVRKLSEKKEKVLVNLKGAPEEVLLAATHYLDKDMKIKKMTKEIVIELEEKIKFYSLQAIRTIAVAYREEKPKAKYTFEDCSTNLVFVGFLGFFDPPVEGVKEALEQAKKAGILVIMITGDSPHTALAVSKQIGLKEGENIKPPILGSELEKLNDEKIVKEFSEGGICARASPEHKLKIVHAFQKKGYIVALTGDGVNDAPALKKANVSIAIGKGGSEVAKSVSDIILVDNNLRTIIRAIEYSKAIFQNIRSFVSYQVTTNISALSLMFFAQLFNFGIVFKPLELLWINLIMDGPPALALGLEKPKKEALLQPIKQNEQILDKKVLFSMLTSAFFMICSSLFIYWYYLGVDQGLALSMIFNVFVLLQIANAFAVHTSDSFTKDIFSNKYLIAAVGIVLILHLGIFNIEQLREFFSLKQLELQEWVVSFLVIVVFLIYTDVMKKIKKKILMFF